MGRIKEWEELTICDNFLFQKVMQNQRLCKRLIEKLPGIKVKNKPLPDYCLRVVFDDNRTVIYDVKDDIRSIPSYQALASICGLFGCVRLDPSRTCVFWNDEIDLPSDTIYEYGRDCTQGTAE